MRTWYMTCAAVWLLTWAATTWGGEGQTKLRMGWPSGDYLMTVVSTTEGTTTVAGETSQTQDRTTQVWQIQVGKPNDKDEKQLTLRLAELKTEGREGSRTYRYDSTAEADANSDLAFVYRPVMATKLNVLLDADDTVVEVSGLDKLWTNLAAKAETAAQKSLVVELRMGLSDKFFEVSFRRWEALIPKSSVAVGDTWRAGVRLDLPYVGELKARYDCRLTGLEKAAIGEVAAFEATAQYTQSNPKTSKIEDVELTLNKVQLNEKANLKVNVRTGQVVADECTRNVEIQGTAGQDGKQQDITSKTKTQIKTTFTAGTSPPARTAKPDAGNTPPAERPTSPPPRGANKASGQQTPVSVILRRQWEPKQKAFTVLVPEGWQIEGGLFSVDPTRGGGVLNSIETKCDFSVKKDAAGSVMVRWAPSYNFVDFSRSPEFASLAGLFPVGRVYNGALVKPLPTVEEYLAEGFKVVRPEATGVKIAQRLPLPELAEILQALSKDLNATMRQLGKQPMTFTSGAVVFDYTEDGKHYREAAATAICDWRAGTGIWSNQFTFHMRAPADQVETWKPVCDIIRQSLKINPEWLAAYVKAVGERGETAAEVFRTLARLDQEIFQRHSRTRSAIQHENYLLLSGQEEFVNPFTKEVERDSSDYKWRWTNSAGDRYYSNVFGSDPNKDPAFNQLEWKQTPVRPRS